MMKGLGKGTVKGGELKSWYGGGYSDETVAALLALVASLKGGSGKGGGKGKTSGNGKFTVDESGGVLGEFLGTIRSFNDYKCYGFIDCPDLAANGYDSVFLHGDMKKGYRVGHVVRFTAFLTAEGKCQAKDLKSGLKGDGASTPGAQPAARMAGPGSNGKFTVDESGGVLGEFLGTIRSFNDWKCYGFIDCPDLVAYAPNGIFLHGDMKKGYQVGNIVRFTAFVNAQGKCQAKDLKSGLK